MYVDIMSTFFSSQKVNKVLLYSNKLIIDSKLRLNILHMVNIVNTHSKWTILCKEHLKNRYFFERKIKIQNYLS